MSQEPQEDVGKSRAFPCKQEDRTKLGEETAGWGRDRREEKRPFSPALVHFKCIAYR